MLMNPLVMEVATRGLLLVLLLTLPPLLSGIAAGCAASLLARVFRIPDPVISPIPRTVAGLLAFAVAAPWIGTHTVEFGRLVLRMIELG